MKKTILITVGHGLVSRNLLRNEFLEIITSRDDIRLVVVTPAAGNPEFEREFSGKGIIFEKMLDNKRRPNRERLINLLHALLIFNGTSKVKFTLRKGTDRFVRLRMWLRKTSAFLFGRSVIIRKAISLLDRAILPDEVNSGLFNKYNPSLVFCTSIIMPREIDLVKAARKARVPVIGMVKSWDNLVKDIPLRMHPDTLLVWNKVMKKQAIRYQLIPEDRIEIVGIPQFDVYETLNRKSDATREQFMKSIKADPDKKLLLFAAEGKWSPADPEIVQIITRFIKDGLLKADCHLHVRPHFCYRDYLEPLFVLEEKGIVTVDKEWNESDVFPEKWDPTERDMMHLAESMKFADIVITSPSTIVLDAVYFDTPVINIGFDGYGSLESKHFVGLLYETEYYKKVMEYQATTYVTSEQQLFAGIKELLTDGGDTKAEVRRRLREDFCGVSDGKAGLRIANSIAAKL